jgi:hypothetical protein
VPRRPPDVALSLRRDGPLRAGDDDLLRTLRNAGAGPTAGPSALRGTLPLGVSSALPVRRFQPTVHPVPWPTHRTYARCDGAPLRAVQPGLPTILLYTECDVLSVLRSRNRRGNAVSICGECDGRIDRGTKEKAADIACRYCYEPPDERCMRMQHRA